MECNAVQCNAMQYNACYIQCNAMQCNVTSIAMHHVLQCSLNFLLQRAYVCLLTVWLFDCSASILWSFNFIQTSCSCKRSWKKYLTTFTILFRIRFRDPKPEIGKICNQNRYNQYPVASKLLVVFQCKYIGLVITININVLWIQTWGILMVPSLKKDDLIPLYALLRGWPGGPNVREVTSLWEWQTCPSSSC